ncbi:MurR/RpiR family transcriptional regulator [Geochorda subterranea]|uniref:MurR/RpiR family transcriptional regulator n=1 Tax=Geochorda subterranea TaxID=3109564 RepID=A0ABZ1BRN4_9FIRM|nr:MurR/RpiR family transcriptional regulator [Limnochorda sp. LNt]WRP15121.1 MurR/RpiR family transcriptional regulator [Limnochorda sp. LNt]
MEPNEVDRARYSASQTPRCLPRLKVLFPQLRPSEQRVARHILDHAPEVVYSSITEVAEQAGVSEATVIRLCRALGFGGFQELKIALSREMVAPERHIHQDIQRGDDLATAIRKVYQANHQALDDTLANLQVRELDALIRAIRNSRRIHLYGSGTSGLSAMDAHYKLMRIGIESMPYTDVHWRASGAALLGPDDLAIVFSHSGSTKDVVDAAALAKRRGATVAAITNRRQSPLARYADILLVTAAEETPFGSGGIPSIIAQLSIIDALFVGLCLADYDKALEWLERTAEGVRPLKY